jgi:hypothetical protein
VAIGEVTHTCFFASTTAQLITPPAWHTTVYARTQLFFFLFFKKSGFSFYSIILQKWNHID